MAKTSFPLCLRVLWSGAEDTMPQWLFAFIAPPATEISWAGRLPTFSRLSLPARALKDYIYKNRKVSTKHSVTF